MIPDFDPKRQIAIIWSVEDVLSVRPDLTDEQAMEVLERVKHKHDATIGVNWETLSIVADILYPKDSQLMVAENNLEDLYTHEKSMKQKTIHLNQDLEPAKGQDIKSFQHSEQHSKQTLLKEDGKNIINDKKEAAYWPDYSVIPQDIEEYEYSWEDTLPLKKQSAKRLYNLGFEVYKIYPEEADIPPAKVQYGIFNHNGLYGIKKTDWDNYLNTDKAVEYLSARFAILDAAQKVFDNILNKDLSGADENITFISSIANHVEKKVLAEYLSGKTAPDNSDIMRYLPDIIDEFTKKIINNGYLKHYGYTAGNVRQTIIKNIDIDELKSYVVSEQGLMIKSQVEGWDDWTTKLLPINVRQAAEWLILNGYENQSDVKSAFYYRQTSDMSDDRNAAENDDAAIVRIAQKYGKLA